MPSSLAPQHRWQRTTLPVCDIGLLPLERAQRLIAGALTLWASRIPGFRWTDHPETHAMFLYCAARINGDRQLDRPTRQQIFTCLEKVGEFVDMEAYQALNVLSLAVSTEGLASKAAPSSSSNAQGPASDYFDDISRIAFTPAPAQSDSEGGHSSHFNTVILAGPAPDRNAPLGAVATMAQKLRDVLAAKRSARKG